ncbi:MAG: hypothetical protein V9G29_00710 [Burkholderiaceae bacterium]
MRPNSAQDIPSTSDLLQQLIASNRALQRQLAAMPAQIAAALQAPKPADSISDDERQALEEIISAAFPSMSTGVPRTASAAELVSHLRTHAPNSAAAVLLKIGDTGIDHAKRLGKLLHRADGLVLGRYILRSGKKLRGSTIWQVSAVVKPS